MGKGGLLGNKTIPNVEIFRAENQLKIAMLNIIEQLWRRTEDCFSKEKCAVILGEILSHSISMEMTTGKEIPE